MTFERLAEIFAGWEIVVFKGHGSGGKQTVTLEVVRKGKSATEVYHEGVPK